MHIRVSRVALPVTVFTPAATLHSSRRALSRKRTLEKSAPVIVASVNTGAKRDRGEATGQGAYGVFQGNQPAAVMSSIYITRK